MGFVFLRCTTAVSILACIKLLVPYIYKEKSYFSLDENLKGNICEKVSRIRKFHTLFVCVCMSTSLLLGVIFACLFAGSFKEHY